MERLKILLVAVAAALSLASCNWNGPRYYDKPQYRNDPSTLARTGGVSPRGDVAGNAGPVPAGISQLLCEHGRAVHHPYRYIASCARADVDDPDPGMLVRYY